MSVASSQRFSRRHPCPICGGGHDEPQGHGTRCYGFLSEDGEYAHCTREEHAGNLAESPAGTFAHRLIGDCACGDRHDPRPTAVPAPKRDRGRVVREIRYDVRDTGGTLAAIRIRREYADGSKSFTWQLPDGTPGLNGRSSVEMPLFGIDRIGRSKYGVITEGEKAQQALASIGIPAVGTMTGAKSLPSDDTLAAIVHVPTIVLWPDNDSDGVRHMQRIGERLVCLGASDVRVVDWPNAPAKGDAADYVTAGADQDAVRHLLREARPWEPEPEPATPGLISSNAFDSSPSTGYPGLPSPQWPDPLADAAYHGLAGEIVRAIEPETEADAAALLLSLLAAVGNVVGAGPHWRVGMREHGLRIYPVFVGQTSKARKGTSWGAIKPLFRLAFPEWLSGQVASGLSSGEGLIYCVRDEMRKTEPIKEKGRIVDYQEVVIDPGVDDKRAFIIEEEFASVLKVMSRESNILSAIIRQAWDDGDLRTLTKNMPMTATGAHITIVGHVTQHELLRYLDDTEAGNGFANRFIWACVRRSKVLPDGGRIDPAMLDHFADQLQTVVRTSEYIGLIERDEQAAALWRDVYGPLSEGGLGLLGAVTSRAEAQVMRLAAIYAVLDETPTMTVEHLKAALAVWRYVEQSAAFIFGDSLGDPIADTVLRALRQSGEMTQTEIANLFGRNQKAARIDQALGLLLSANKVLRMTREPEGGRGRPAVVWSSR